jgi:uncharacterized membrane protein
MKERMTLLMCWAGLLMLALGIPLARRRVAPNRMYGFRTRSTLADAALWYDVNAKCGVDMIAIGLGSALLPPVLYLSGASVEVIALGSSAATVVALTVSTIRCALFIRQRTRDTSAAPRG